MILYLRLRFRRIAGRLVTVLSRPQHHIDVHIQFVDETVFGFADFGDFPAQKVEEFLQNPFLGRVGDKALFDEDAEGLKEMDHSFIREILAEVTSKTGWDT